MAGVYQVPHHAFGWLLGGTLLAGLPHLWLGPWWLAAAFPLALLWRVLVHRGLARLPGRNLRIVFMLGALGGTFHAHGTLLGPEAGTCLLAAAFGLKMLETHRFRDAYILVMLGYFVLATAFLFWQDIFISLYVMGVMMMLTASLVGMHHAGGIISAWRHLRLAAVMMLQAVPLMVVLFVLVPRIEPLWSLERDEPRAETGVSDEVSPGDIGELSESDALAFRVRFQGDPPPNRERYWRGLTLSRFDGRTWSRAGPLDVEAGEHAWFPGEPPPQWLRQLEAAREGEVLSYQIVLEPTARSWLFALSVPFSDHGDRQVGMARDMTLVPRNEVNQRMGYSVRSYPGAARAMPLGERERRLNLHLPEDSNPRAREDARQLREQAGSDDAFIEQVLRRFHEQEFYYTLRPARLGDHSVDEFLYSTREGFCEHYASAFAFLMRAADIPARLVVGYQGGEMNPVGNHLRVTQAEAHAWVEVWREEEGWTRVDPTAAVAPERIELGLDDALGDAGPGAAGAGMGRWRDLPGLRSVANLADYVQFAWQQWVIGYDQQSQLELFQQWFGDMSPRRVALVMAVAAGVIVLPLALWILLRRRMPAAGPLEKEYQRLVRWLRRRGVVPRPGETPRQLVERAARSLPTRARELRRWGKLFERLAYAGDMTEESVWRELRRTRRRLGTGWPGTRVEPE